MISPSKSSCRVRSCITTMIPLGCPKTCKEYTTTTHGKYGLHNEQESVAVGNLYEWEEAEVNPTAGR